MMRNGLDATLPRTHKPRVVIIGGGFAGINLAKRLDDHRFQVVLLDKNNHHVFQPLLYQVATAGLEPEAICSPVRKILVHKKDFHFRMVSVHRVNLELGCVETDAGGLSYDYLVIATGAATHFFGNPDFENRALPLKDIGDALNLRNHLVGVLETAMLTPDQTEREALMTVVVVGGGPTGVEVAGAIAELKQHVLRKDYPDLEVDRFQIVLVEGMSRLLTDMSETAGNKALSYLKRLGVTVHLQTRSTHYDGYVLRLDDGSRIRTRTVIWAAGVEPVLVPGLESSSIEGRRFKVNSCSQVLAEPPDLYHDNVFAIGDVSLMRTRDWPEGLPGMAPVAIQQGRLLAQNLKRISTGRTLKPFKYTDKGTMATIGRNCAVAEMKRRFVLSGFIGWVTWMVVHLWYLIGFRNKVIVSIDWLWNYFTYDRGVRAIIRSSKTEER